MAARTKLDINPVFNHRKSIALVDTAEDLVDSLDNLSVCLKHIEEKYIKENKGNPRSHDDKALNEVPESLYVKLRDNLEVARDLTDTLKREKWRLSRREMSIELRMGELEDYKSHLKKDMTDMNQTVEVLSMRIVQLENALVEQQEIQESMEAEKSELLQQVADQKHAVKDLESRNGKLSEEIKTLKEERKDKVLRQHSRELKDKMEILVLENQRLKEIIREKDEQEPTGNNEDGSDTGKHVKIGIVSSAENNPGSGNKTDACTDGGCGTESDSVSSVNNVRSDINKNGVKDKSDGNDIKTTTTFTETTAIAYV